MCDSVACVVDKLNPAAAAGSDDSANISVPSAYDTRDITISIRDAIRAKSTRTSRVYFRNFAVGELIKRAVVEFEVPAITVPRDSRFVETRLGGSVLVDSITEAGPLGNPAVVDPPTVRKYQIDIGVRVFIPDYEEVIGVASSYSEAPRSSISGAVRSGQTNGHNAVGHG